MYNIYVVETVERTTKTVRRFNFPTLKMAKQRIKDVALVADGKIVEIYENIDLETKCRLENIDFTYKVLKK